MSSKELCDSDNVVRHANSEELDDNGDATYAAFHVIVSEETDLSVSRLNRCISDKKQQLVEIRLVLGRNRELKASHGLAELNVGKTKEMVHAQFNALSCSLRLRFIDDPIDSNQWHATIQLPVVDIPDPQGVADLIAVWIALSVIKTHPARLD